MKRSPYLSKMMVPFYLAAIFVICERSAIADTVIAHWIVQRAGDTAAMIAIWWARNHP